AELDGREEERDGVAGARDGAQLAPVGAVALAVHLAPPAREVEQHELELERTPVEFLEVDVRLDPADQAIHREERHAEERVGPQAGREDARQRAELLPRRLEPRHPARAVAAGVDTADRSADDGIGHDAALLEALERAHVVRAEGRTLAQDEDPLLPLGHRGRPLIDRRGAGLHSRPTSRQAAPRADAYA